MNELLQCPEYANSVPGRNLLAKPLGFVDVGARGGVHKIAEKIAGATAILAFEPDPEECQRLISEMASGFPWAAYEIEPVALGENDGTSQLYVLNSAVNCSLLPPNAEFIKRYAMKGFEVVKTIPMKITALDNVLYGSRGGVGCWGEFIKIDTQGTEFEILRGAARTLEERTVALLIEVEFFQMYEGEKLFSEVEQFLRGKGFSFYGFDIHTRSAKLLEKRRSAGRERTYFADAIFFKDPLAGGLWKKPMSQRGLSALFSCALLLEYYDFALQLALETWAAGDEADRIRKITQREASRRADRAYDDVLALAERVRVNPDRANVEVGKFVDARRHLADYNDVRD